MEERFKKYLEIQKENFTNDPLWTTPEELAKNRQLIHNEWIQEHDEHDDFWNVLLKDITENKDLWKGKKALEYGIGFGGNIAHLLNLAEWDEVVGYDISKSFVKFVKEYINLLEFKNFNIYETTGAELSFTSDNYFDFIMSYTVLQHIAPHFIRFNLLKEFYRVLVPGGILSFQMNMESGIPYYSNDWEKFNRPNCKVEDPKQVIFDLDKIGFKDSTYIIKSNPRVPRKNTWVYFRAVK